VSIAYNHITDICPLLNIHSYLPAEDVTAGKYKRTLSPYKEPNNNDRDHVQKSVEAILTEFKTHISTHRPQVAVDDVATGEVWQGTKALEVCLEYYCSILLFPYSISSGAIGSPVFFYHILC